MIIKTLKILLGIAAFPVCISVSTGLYEQINQISGISYYHKYFLLGGVAYLIIHAAVFKPEYLYILGHEIMHAIATWLSGGKVTSFSVSSKGGRVGTTKSNIFIALAPYFFPFYTIMISLVFFVITTVLEIDPPYIIFLFLLGFTLTFHIILTIDFMKIKQTDFVHAGYLFSTCLIYIINLIEIGFVLSVLFKEVIFKDFIFSAYIGSLDIYTGVFRQLFM